MDAKPISPVPASAAALACRTCEAPATIRNVSGKEECLCEEHYRQELAVYNDFWNT